MASAASSWKWKVLQGYAIEALKNSSVGIGDRLRRRHRRGADEARCFDYPSMWTIKAGQDRAHERRSMSTVKNALAQKSGALIHVRSGDMVVEALRQMRDNRVRSVLVIDDDVLVGIVTQGDCAIKVLLPGLDAKQTPVGQVMTGNPVTVKPDDRLEGCMAMMAQRGFRHLPVLDAGKVVGVISIGDVVKNIIRDLEHNVDDLMGYIMKDSPGG
jgi:CBS domain-containing protein